jgi:hypothetical protein
LVCVRDECEHNEFYSAGTDGVVAQLVERLVRKKISLRGLIFENGSYEHRDRRAISVL